MKPLSMTNKIIMLTMVWTKPVSLLLMHNAWNVDMF